MRTWQNLPAIGEHYGKIELKFAFTGASNLRKIRERLIFLIKDNIRRQGKFPMAMEKETTLEGNEVNECCWQSCISSK